MRHRQRAATLAASRTDHNASTAFDPIEIFPHALFLLVLHFATDCAAFQIIALFELETAQQTVSEKKTVIFLLY